MEAVLKKSPMINFKGDFLFYEWYYQTMEKIDKILLPVMARKGLGGAAVSSQICFYASEYGKGCFEAVSFSKGVLKLSCADSIDSGEVQMMSEEIIDYVNKKIGKNIVSRIRIVNRFE